MAVPQGEGNSATRSFFEREGVEAAPIWICSSFLSLRDEFQLGKVDPRFQILHNIAVWVLLDMCLHARQLHVLKIQLT